MSQSLGNYIGVDDPAEDIFGKTMSIPDELMAQWLLLAADAHPDEVAAISSRLADGTAHPGLVKRDLARRLVALYWDDTAAVAAEEAFDLVHRRGEIPDDIPEHPLPPEATISLPSLLRDAGLAASAGEARRLIQQGAVKLDGTRVESLELDRVLLVGAAIQVGKRRFARLV
jgi:tyrosyl-tRNA synthetase